MAKKPARDLTREEQLARGPMDLPFLMLVLLLLGIGIIMLLSASSVSARYDDVSQGSPTYYFTRQLLFGVAGVAVLYLVSKINYQTFRLLSVFVLAGGVALLVLVLVPGLGVEVNKATRWLKLFLVAGPTYQPSEIAKIGVIMYFAARLSKRQDGPVKLKHRLSEPFETIRAALNRIGLLELIPYAAILLLIAVLMLLEPHMSGTILVFIGGAAVLFAAGIRMYWFVGGGLVAAGGLWVIMNTMSHTSTRLETWYDPWTAYQNGVASAYQIIQSLYAIGSGGLLGLGLGQSRQKYLYLPEEQNDFIFPIICEELGLIGACLVLVLFILLIVRGYWIALHARDRFGALLVVGITTLFAAQVFLNVAVVTNLIPTTGISLPFFSYGGTALMIQLAEMGMVLSVSRQIPAPRQG